MIYDLSRETWELAGFLPYTPLLNNSMETGVKLNGMTSWMKADVPGGVALTLYRNGWIDYPYYEMNSLKAEWIENKWWVYRTTFKKPALSGVRYKLVFKGLDYEAMVYLNNELLGEHEGMYHPAVFDITDAFENNDVFELRVLLKHAPDEMSQIGYTSQTFTQKSRYNYKWDFSTRLVNLGLWQGVELVAEQECLLADPYVRSDVDETGTGHIHVSGEIKTNGALDAPCKVVARVLEKGKEVASAQAPLEEKGFKLDLAVANPRLWYTNGLGESFLYDVEIVLLCGDRECDRHTLRQGIRSLRYAANEDAPADALPYTVVVNGEKIYIKGVNMTPIDMIYGDIPAEHYAYILRAAANMNVNMIRIWGGGIIEQEIFYDLCDELGIMVWQDFIQSSSGIDNEPSKLPKFMELIEKSALAAVKQKRNHTSMTVWCGGNELMIDYIPVDYQDKNIALLKDIVDRLDPTRLFLPSSASGPSFMVDGPKGTNHDVHGHWKYVGNPGHYELYDDADNLLHSEFGCDGMSSRPSQNKILSQARQTPRRMTEDDVWRFHGEWWDTYDRDQYFFGQVEDMDTFIAGSQWVQAEGLRFILEADARRRFQNSGSLIWQFNEPWPNISCTALMEYYGRPKMAYYWTQKAYANFHASLAYRKLDFPAGSDFTGRVYLNTDFNCKEGPVTVACEAFDVEGQLLWSHRQQVQPAYNRATFCFDASFQVPQSLTGMFLVRVTATMGERRDVTDYFFSTLSQALYAQVLNGEKPALEAVRTGSTQDRLTYTVTNRGKRAALHVHAVETSDRFNILLEDNYVTLLPGESPTFAIACSKKFRFGFDEYAQVGEGQPEIHFTSL